MSGEKGCCKETSIPATNDKHQEKNGIQAWILRVWNFGKEDTSRLTFALKVGLAVLFVSLLVLIQAPYDVFGTGIIWSFITVVIMFEYTVGFFSLSSLVLAYSLLVRSSFLKQWPSLVPYEYGFRVSLFTFCLIIVSGYRMGNPIKIAMDRMCSIAIGGFIAVFVNVLIFPLWAGEQLHKELVDSFDAVSDSLQECVGKYFEDDGSGVTEFSRNVLDEFSDELD